MCWGVMKTPEPTPPVETRMRTTEVRAWTRGSGTAAVGSGGDGVVNARKKAKRATAPLGRFIAGLGDYAASGTMAEMRAPSSVKAVRTQVLAATSSTWKSVVAGMAASFVPSESTL